jgi:hypothetical protein
MQKLSTQMRQTALTATTRLMIALHASPGQAGDQGSQRVIRWAMEVPRAVPRPVGGFPQLSCPRNGTTGSQRIRGPWHPHVRAYQARRPAKNRDAATDDGKVDGMSLFIGIFARLFSSCPARPGRAFNKYLLWLREAFGVLGASGPQASYPLPNELGGTRALAVTFSARYGSSWISNAAQIFTAWGKPYSAAVYANRLP